MVYYILVFSGRETYRLSRSKRLLLSSSWFKYKIIVFLIPLYCVLLVICFCNFNYEWVVIGLSWTQVMMGPWISPNPDLIRLSVHAGLNCVYYQYYTRDRWYSIDSIYLDFNGKCIEMDLFDSFKSMKISMRISKLDC